MDPEQPAGQNNYDFILNPEAKKKKTPLLAGNNPKQRILIIAAVGGVLLIVFFIFMSVVFGGKNSADSLLDLAQKQTEIIRVSDLGFRKAKSGVAKNLALNTKLTMQSSLNSTTERLAKLGTKPKPKTLALQKNIRTDQTLTTAGLNNKFDTTLVETIQKLLNDYRAALKTTYDASNSQADKQLLNSSYQAVSLLLEQKVVTN